MEKIELNDERLRHAVREAKSAIEQRLEKLDRVSSDLKQIERYLEEYGVKERVTLEFSGGQTALGSEDYELATEDLEYIAWEQFGGKDRWRLTYLKTHRDGSWTIDDLDMDGEGYGDGFCFVGEPEVLDHRPLIETPAETRLRAVEALPDLVATIASNLKVTRLA